MARLLSQTLIRTSISPPSAPILSPHGLIIHRHRSNRAQLIELELDDAADGEAEGLRRLEDVIQSIIARRSAPDWLPFLPGSSYWVPPRVASPGRRPSCDAIEVVARLGARRCRSLAEDESMSLSSARGWPSSAFFIEGTTTTRPVPVPISVPVEVEVEMKKVHTESENASQSEDEE